MVRPALLLLAVSSSIAAAAEPIGAQTNRVTSGLIDPHARESTAPPAAKHLACLAVWREHLVALNLNGAVHVWDSDSFVADKALSQKLSRAKLSALAAQGEALFGTDGTTLWEFDGTRWAIRQSRLPGRGALVRFLAEERGPVLVYEEGVYDTRTQRWFDRLADGELRAVTTSKIFGNQLWLGGARGKEGGQLLVLDLETGHWTQQLDDERCPTGISYGPTGTVVSWQGARPQLVVHSLDGSAAGTLMRRERGALRTVALNPYDRALYSVDAKRLVKISRGRLEPIAEVGIPLEDSPQLEVVAEDTFALGGAKGQVVVIRDGKTQSLDR
ncbi:MAG: hypothetical protein ACT4TC_06550 [Myxococcaceae bacterium]